MKPQLILMVLICALFVSCSESKIDMPEKAERTEFECFHATIEEPETTKVFADEKLRVLWDSKDHISVFFKYTYNHEYAFTGETGANAGDFQKVPNDEIKTGNDLDYVYAVYPYQRSTSITNDGDLRVTLPAQQSYRELSFGREANTMVSITEDNELHFKNLCGYVAIKLYGEEVDVASIVLKGNQHEPLAGNAKVVAAKDVTPELTFAETATESIELICDPPVRLGSTPDEATIFWIVVPPMTFREGFTIKVTDKDGRECCQSTD